MRSLQITLAEPQPGIWHGWAATSAHTSTVGSLQPQSSYSVWSEIPANEFALMATQNWKGRQLDVEMAHLEAEVETEIYIELSNGYYQTKNHGGRLNEAMYGLVHAGLLRSRTCDQDLLRKGLKRSEADPCVYREDAGRPLCSNHRLLRGQSSPDQRHEGG